MPNSIDVRVIYRHTVADLRRIDRSTDRATMWAVREAGRKVKQAAKRQAPVYKGRRKDIPKGRLKKSIHSSRRLGGGAGTYSVTVAPRGWPAKGYAPQQEARTPYMRPAFESISPQMPAIAASAWSRAIRRR